MGPEVRYFPNAIPDGDRLFQLLRDSVQWEHRVGRMGSAPRLVAWYGEYPYVYSGIRHEACPMTEEIETIRHHVGALSPKAYDGVLLNLYRDGQDSVAWHSDDEPEMGPLIASVSLGETRKFRLRRKDDHKNVVEYELRSGDLLVMYGRCQQEWEHTIPKTRKPVGERINLTFRQMEVVRTDERRMESSCNQASSAKW